MSTQLEPVRPTLALSPDNFRELLRRPLLALPPEVRPDCLALWSCHQHLFPSALPVAAALSTWMNDHGLHPDDARVILRGLLSPERMGRFRFASDLMTALADDCRAAIDRRKARERRNTLAIEGPAPLGHDDVRDMLSRAGWLGGVTDEDEGE